MNGVISTNLPVGSEPFYIPLPQSFSSANTENGVVSDQYKDIKNLVVLDTKSTTTVTLDSFKSLNTLSLVTSKYIVSYDKNGSIVFSDVSKYPDFVLDQGLIDKVFGLAKFIPIAVPFFMFMIVYGLVFFELFFLLIPAFIFFILSKMIKARRSFSESYKICVYSSTWPAILSVATFFIALKIPFLFTFLVLLIALINTKRDHIEETVVVPEDTEVK